MVAAIIGKGLLSGARGLRPLPIIGLSVCASTERGGYKASELSNWLLDWESRGLLGLCRCRGRGRGGFLRQYRFANHRRGHMRIMAFVAVRASLEINTGA